MHDFSDLIERCWGFTSSGLSEIETSILEELKTSSATPLIKNLQMIQLSKVVFVVGAFSLFEAYLQKQLNCRNGFSDIKRILKESDEELLFKKFSDIELAINALKHGEGKSHQSLVTKKGGVLETLIKDNHNQFLNEGDVSEVDVLVDVNNKFVIECIDVITKVTEFIKRNDSNSSE